MRLIAISVIIFCGSMMACVGVITDDLPNPHSLSNLEGFGIGVVLVAGLLFVIEWWPADLREKATRFIGSIAR